MKVQINLSKQQTITFGHLFNYLTQIPTNTQENKVIRSLLVKVGLKVQKKALDLKAQPNLFTKPKKTQFTFEYYEAYYIQKYLQIVEKMIPLCPYDGNVTLFLISTFNQKIA